MEVFMNRGIPFLSALALGVLMLGRFEGRSVANAAAAGQSLAASNIQAGAIARGDIVHPARSRDRGYRGYRPRHFHGGWYGYRRYHRGPRFRFYFGPSFAYPGYGYGYRRYGSCSYWRYRCAQNWGYGNSNYYGCLRYHGCW
jgi:hypothetical protein